MTNYYLIDVLSTTGRVYSAIDENGVPLDRHEPYRPKRVSVEKIDKTKLLDFPSSVGSDFVISSKAYDIIKDFKSDFCLIPTTVLSDGEDVVTSDYYICLPEIEHDILDETKSNFELFYGDIVANRIKKWVLDSSKVPTLDIFFTPYLQWVISDELYKVLKKAKFSNLKFTKI